MCLCGTPYVGIGAMYAFPKAPSERELSSECETEGERETNERAVEIWRAEI